MRRLVGHIPTSTPRPLDRALTEQAALRIGASCPCRLAFSASSWGSPAAMTSHAVIAAQQRVPGEFGQQLAALHKPIANDWAARFGIETPLRRALSEQHALTFAEAPTAGACALCHAPVSQRVAAYCAGNATRLGDRILCYKCQRRPAVPGSR